MNNCAEIPLHDTIKCTRSLTAGMAEFDRGLRVANLAGHPRLCSVSNNNGGKLALRYCSVVSDELDDVT